MKNKTIISPSIFASDFAKLGEEAKRCEESGADAIHVDIMDGHFVRNLSLSPKALAAINRSTDLFLDVHIMVYDPFRYIEELVKLGADQITFHFEATEEVEETLNYIKKCGVKAGLAFCPETSESLVVKYLDKIDTLLMMTVHPGFGGQAFIEDVLPKIEFLRKLADDSKLDLDIQVDGGVDDKTAPLCLKAGANNLVAGTYLFKGDEMAQKITELRG
ncbi:MAG: Ribulose-phosphate 3-epimerase [Chlamydiia bacterium]|nr:Ribulose-phosphate 3-epimerase [Chlamydiia bacterium]MCH9615172.1 Ribulose-phosphate 3-epimerase [Chlamydiia bacterium]MCH9628506.1 Ribulose-phosphate 3-epimerase [Chlamydiia bacterium]